MKDPDVIIYTRVKESNKVWNPRSQVIVTGKTLTAEQIPSVWNFSQSMKHLKCWCDTEGNIGYLDGLMDSTRKELLDELQSLAIMFPFLELGLTIMSGPPGTPVMPILSLKLQGRKVREVSAIDAHFGHPPPKRLMPKKQ